MFGPSLTLAPNGTIDEATDVVVTWWEHNQTDNVPIAKISNDGGGTFNDLIRLSANGTITQEGER
jgi:hypothetical protein